MTIADLTDLIEAMHSNLKADYTFTPENVYQEGSDTNRELIGSLMDTLMLPGSGIHNKENLKQLYQYSKEGKACLLLIEHYSNFDYPTFFRLIHKDPDLGPEVASSLLPIRGMKLSEGNDITSAFSRSYDSIIIYPSRSIDQVKDPEKLKEIKAVSVPINHAAIKELTHRKHHGRMITVFPAGTRFRPWDPDSKKGVREIYSYLKTFDHVVFISINGNTLLPSESEDMTHDKPTKDLMLFSVSEPMRAKRIRKEWQEEAPEGEDPKQYVVDRVMEILSNLHEENKKEYQRRLEAIPEADR